MTPVNDEGQHISPNFTPMNSRLLHNLQLFGGRGQTWLCAGDMPIVLTQDGPSFGGFVCPCTITLTEIWKMGQVSPNDRVHFKPTSLGRALQRG